MESVLDIFMFFLLLRLFFMIIGLFWSVVIDILGFFIVFHFILALPQRRLQVGKAHHRIQLRIFKLCLNINLIEISLIVSKGLSYGKLDDSIGGRQWVY